MNLDGNSIASEVAPGRNSDVLGRLQRALELLYRVDTDVDVGDFVIPGEARALLGVTRAPREQLLLRHDHVAERLEIGLYVDEDALSRLAAPAPPLDMTGPFGDRLQEYLLAVEGVSHFVYVMVRAQARRPFSALELELQGEVDKYLLVLLGAWREGGAPPTGVRERLFQQVKLDDNLSPQERERYTLANAAAGEYAAVLEERYVRHRLVEEMLRELRRFYRMNCAAKLDHIAQATGTARRAA